LSLLVQAKPPGGKNVDWMAKVSDEQYRG